MIYFIKTKMPALIVASLAVALSACSRTYSVNGNIADTIKCPSDWHDNQAEIIYIALRGQKEEVDKLFRLIPMATKDDCTCMAGSPGDAAAVVIAREYEMDPGLKILSSMVQLDRNYIYRYASVCKPLDWDEEGLVKAYDLKIP